MRQKQTSKKKPGSQPRKRRGQATDLPVFLHGACEFSDDPKGLDNALWVVRAIKQELIGGAGPVGNLWQELRDQLDAVIAAKKDNSGRRRIKGDWLLLFVGYVMSKQPEMMEFWKNEAFDAFWVEAGFDIATKPSEGTLWERFRELEGREFVERGGAAADALIRNAMTHDDDIGCNVHIDSTGFHSRAVLHHACLDPEACKAAGGRVTPISATPRIVREERWREAQEEALMSLRAQGAPDKIERPDPKTLKRGDFKLYIWINGHRWGLHDPDAGVRAYKSADGEMQEFWIGGYDTIAVDGKYGAKLQGLISSASRNDCNLYFPLMRRLHRTLGRWPEVATGDRSHSIDKTFRFNTRRGIASISPFRKQKGARRGVRICDTRRLTSTASFAATTAAANANSSASNCARQARRLIRPSTSAARSA
jgi:hypothetical protein